MRLHVLGMIVCVSLFIRMVSGCSVLPPDISVIPHVDWRTDADDGSLLIDYSFKNDGTVDLENFKFRFGIDETVTNGTIDYDDITDWYPEAGTTLNVGETISGTYDTGLVYAGGVAYVGVYEMGCDNPPDS